MSETFAIRRSDALDESEISLDDAFPSKSLSKSPKFLQKSRQARIRVLPSESGRDVSSLEFHIFAGGILLMTTGLAIILFMVILLVSHSEFFIILPFGTLVVIIVIFLASGVIHFPLCAIMVISSNSVKNISSFAHTGEIIICLNIALLMTIPVIAQIAKPDSDLWKQELSLESSAPPSYMRDRFFLAWDLVQNKFDCCGVHSVKDWGLSARNIPRSCCETFENGNCSKWHSNGCSRVFSEYHYKYFNLATGISVIAIVNNVLSLTTILIALRISKKQSKVAQVPAPPAVPSSEAPTNSTRKQPKSKLIKPTVSFKNLDETRGGALQPDDISYSSQSWIDRVFPEVKHSVSPFKYPKRLATSYDENDPVVQIIESVSGPEIDAENISKKDVNDFGGSSKG